VRLDDQGVTGELDDLVAICSALPRLTKRGESLFRNAARR
jgi:hypothetical protein